MFKTGDEVICVDAGKTKLINGKKYKIYYTFRSSYNKYKYSVIVEGITSNTYRSNRFKKITRIDKINKILNKVYE